MENILSTGTGNAPQLRPTTVASVVTWNHAHCIENCILSLLRQTRPPSEIFICDNASADSTREVLETFKGRVTLFYSTENRGFCGGHNLALARTQSDFVLLVNPDVVLQTDYIEKATRTMFDDDKVGTVCGLLLQEGADPEARLVDGAGLIVARSRRFLLRYHAALAGNTSFRKEEVFGCDGALPFYRRSMINSLSFDGQFFDEMFFAHKEDHDVSWRARLLGWKTVFDPACVATHPRVFRPGNLELRKRLTPELKYHAVKNDLLLLLKNEAPANFVRDFLHIVPRRLAILCYALLIEQHSLKAYWFVFRHWTQIMQARRRIRERTVVAPADLRAQFSLGSS